MTGVVCIGRGLVAHHEVEKCAGRSVRTLSALPSPSCAGTTKSLRDELHQFLQFTGRVL